MKYLPVHYRSCAKIRYEISASPPLSTETVHLYKGQQHLPLTVHFTLEEKDSALMERTTIQHIKCEFVEVCTFAKSKQVSAEDQKALFLYKCHLPDKFRFAVPRCFKAKILQKRRKKNPLKIWTSVFKLQRVFLFLLWTKKKNKILGKFCEKY